MKAYLLRFLLVSSLFASGLFAQEEPVLAPAVVPVRPPEQLDQLFGPIALYPDALIALILPASTFSSDIVLAARFLDANGDRANADNEPWDDSVKALAHYPEVIRWMDQNLAWTRQAGDAFVAQPADVMNAVQRLRARARAAGTLVNTPQQLVVVDDGNIRIIPAEPEVIYVPRYDPEVVYVTRSVYYPDPFLTFGVGFATGYWLGYDCDWGHRRIWTVDRRDRERFWHERRDWRYPSYPGRRGAVVGNYRHHTWEPRHDYYRSYRSPSRGDYRRNRPEGPRPVVTPREAARVPEARPRLPDYPHDRNSRPGSDRRNGTNSGGSPRGNREDRQPVVAPDATVQTTPPSSPSPQPARIQAPSRPNSERFQRNEASRPLRSGETRNFPSNPGPREARLTPAPAVGTTSAPQATVSAPRYQAPTSSASRFQNSTSSPAPRAEPAAAPQVQREASAPARSERSSSGRTERPDRIRASSRE